MQQSRIYLGPALALAVAVGLARDSNIGAH